MALSLSILILTLSHWAADLYLGVLPEHYKDFHIDDRYIETHVCKRLPVNWKAAEEAFMEAYHVIKKHTLVALSSLNLSQPMMSFQKTLIVSYTLLGR